MHKAYKSGQVTGLSLEEKLKSARAIGLITEQQEQLIVVANEIRTEVCAVDDFSTEELHKSNLRSSKEVGGGNG